MGFNTSIDGTLNTTSIQQHPELTSNNTTLVTPDDTISKREYVANTFNNLTAVNVDRFNQVANLLHGIAEGSPISVTYYKDMKPETNIKGKMIGPEDTVHPAHRSYLKIHNFEIRLTAALQYEYNNDSGISRLSGEGVTYPGFVPERGDRFVMEVDNGKLGLLEINEVPTRTSYRSATYYHIVFFLTDVITDAIIKEVEDTVSAEAWFDKKRFLNESGALLYHDEYVELKYLCAHRYKMLNYYVSKFFDKGVFRSFMRPDEVYDPYVTDFMSLISEYADMGGCPVQFYPDAPFMDVNIWRAIINETIPLEAVPSSTSITTYKFGSKSTRMNALINKKYLSFVASASLVASGILTDSSSSSETEETEGDLIASDTTSDAILGDLLLHLHPHYCECPLVNFDSLNTGDNNGFGTLFSGTADHIALVRSYLTSRTIDLTKLHACIAACYALSPMEQFYKMPFYIYLAAKAVQYIRKEVGIYE